MMKRLSKAIPFNRILWSFTALLFACAVIPTSLMPFPVGHDTRFHILRLMNIASEMKLGNFLPAIYSFALNGLGYGSPLFYPDLFFYPFAALHAWGVPVVTVFRLMQALMPAAIFFSMYFCAGALFRDRTQAHLAALSYAFSFYAATDVFYRASIGECFGFIFLPIVYLGYHSILHHRPDRWWILAFGMTGILYTHVLSVLLSVILLAVLALSDARLWLKHPGKIRYCVYAAVLCLGLSCRVWLPMLEQLRQLSFRLNNDVHGVEAFLNSMYTPLRLLLPPIGATLLPGDAELGLPRWTGLFGYLAMASCLMGADRQQRKSLLKPLLLSGFFVWLCGRWSLSHLLAKPLAVLQFPWRLMLPAVLMLSLFIGAGWGALKSKRLRGLVLVLTVLSGFTALIVDFPTELHQDYATQAAEAGVTPDAYSDLYISPDAVSGGQYLPDDLPYDHNVPHVEARASSPDVVLNLDRNALNQLHVAFSGNPGDAYVDLPLILYAGYEARTDQGETLPVSRGDQGMVRVALGTLPSGSFTVVYAGTTLQRIADVITLLFIVLCELIYLLRRRHRKVPAR